MAELDTAWSALAAAGTAAAEAEAAETFLAEARRLKAAFVLTATTPDGAEVAMADVYGAPGQVEIHATVEGELLDPAWRPVDRDNLLVLMRE